MGIGISYTGSNGITSAFSSNSADDAMSRLREVVGQNESLLFDWRAKKSSFAPSWNPSVNKTKEQRESEREARDLKQREKGYAKFAGMTYKEWKALNADSAKHAKAANVIQKGPAKGIIDKAKEAKEKIKKMLGFNGALEEKFGKLNLKGESAAHNGGFFGKNIRGVFGFFGIDSFDEPKIGKNISHAINTDDESQGDDIKQGEGIPWTEDYVTRIFATGGMSDEETSNRAPILLKMGYRNHRMTSGGRVFSVGEENIIDICAINVDRPYGCCELRVVDDPVGGKSWVWKNLFFRVGGRTYDVSSYSQPARVNCIIFLEINTTGQAPIGNILCCNDLEELRARENDISKYVAPLYTIFNWEIVCDWRMMPQITMSEFVL